MKKFIKSTLGGSMVEFALIAPLLFVLLFGIIEFGFYLYNWQVLTNATREGARRGIVQDSPRIPEAEIKKMVKDYADEYLITFAATKPTFTDIVKVENITAGGSSCVNFADNLKVSVTYPYTFLVMPNFISEIGKFPPVSSVSVMKCE